MIEVLNTAAKAPIQFVLNWLTASFRGILETPEYLVKGVQALMTLIATALLIPAVAWFVAFKATQITVKITATAIDITASAVSGSSS
ncbi:hypothetical protein [Coleofasciculus sp. H7-2]|uniref:hypothetical protein n=1 Tax=Coleofasciculus sp. H7-2 TaxID=3351545 RepID=UPI00366F3AF9